MAILTETIQFEITIKKKKTVRFESTSESLLEERHYTDEERKESYQRWVDNDKEYTKKVYTQVPSVGSRTDEVEIFSQVIESPEFDIKKVIGAINDLKQ